MVCYISNKAANLWHQISSRLTVHKHFYTKHFLLNHCLIVFKAIFVHGNNQCVYFWHQSIAACNSLDILFSVMLNSSYALFAVSSRTASAPARNSRRRYTQPKTRPRHRSQEWNLNNSEFSATSRVFWQNKHQPHYRGEQGALRNKYQRCMILLWYYCARQLRLIWIADQICDFASIAWILSSSTVSLLKRSQQFSGTMPYRNHFWASREYSSDTTCSALWQLRLVKLLLLYDLIKLI